MHPEIQSDKPGSCPKCGMKLVESSQLTVHSKEHGGYEERKMKAVSEMPAGRSEGIGWGFWEKFKMSMTMSMGMEHTGLAGREMAGLMEEDIRQKFFFALLLSIPIIAYSPLGEKVLGINLPQPVPVA